VRATRPHANQREGVGVDAEGPAGIGANPILDLVGQPGDHPTDVVIVEDAAGTDGGGVVDHVVGVDDGQAIEKRVETARLYSGGQLR
jgi:hypothetical protein